MRYSNREAKLPYFFKYKFYCYFNIQIFDIKTLDILISKKYFVNILFTKYSLTNIFCFVII